MVSGKLPSENLKKLLDKLKNKRPETLQGAELGLDAAVLDFEGDLVAISTDPITGAAEGIGALAIDVSVNDIATTGGEAVGVLLTLLLPPGTEISEIKEIMTDAEKRAEELNVEIVGGHTEITNAVTRTIVIGTVLGRVPKEVFPDVSKIRPGHEIFMTKSAPMSAASILSHEYGDFLKELNKDLDIKYLKSLGDKVSVQKDGEIGAKYAHYLHDITEGGILGALYEASVASGYGIEIEKDFIPIDEEFKKLAKTLEINPYRTLATGSMIIISEEGEKLEKAFKEENISLTKIGMVTESGKILVENGEKKEIEPPIGDDLFRSHEIIRRKKEELC